MVFERGRGAWHGGAWVAVLGCVACDADPSPAAPDPEPMTVEVLYVGLDGRFDTFSNERGAALADVLADTPDDVLCLSGLWDADARAALVSALHTDLPFSLTLPTSSTTPVDDPTDANGKVPAPWIDPPCAGGSASALAAVAGCLEAMCVPPEVPGYAGAIAGDWCYEDPISICTGYLEQLETADGPAGRCAPCFLRMARSGRTPDDISDACTRPGDALAFDGDSGLVLLSRWPISRPDLTVLPSTGQRRVFLSATVTTPKGREVRVACGTLGSTSGGLPVDGAQLGAYPGLYGGWDDEHDLQIEKLLAFIDRPGDDGPTVVLGMFGDSPGRTKDGEVVIAPSGGTSVARLDDAFTLAAPADYLPACTLCPDNVALPAPALPSWPNRIYLHGLGPSNVESAVRTHLGSVVDVPSAITPYVTSAPVSPVYGFRSRLRVP